MEWLDRLAAGILAPLAVWVLASGLDDLFLDLAYLYLWCQSRLRGRRGAFAEPPRGPAAEPGIAILVPCWQEAGVIGQMLDANLTAIDYPNYEVWVGVYPNDPATLERVRAAQARFPNVRHVVCPSDGPTTKADCLNAIYKGLCDHETASGRRYEILVQHDAEDLIHPHSLREASVHCAHFDMVQLPVFPLDTPLHWFTHGAYCDDFAESHLKELYVRSRLGGFVPSAGVGTAYRREALFKLSRAKGGRPFDPESLTEDYVIGLELRRLNCSQTLLLAPRPPADLASGRAKTTRRGHGELIATRSYFPFGVRAAIRQRARWVTGNALQSWARFGWRVGPSQWYWLWRDRKGLTVAWTSALANVLFLYGLARWLAFPDARSWSLQAWWSENTGLAAILWANLALVAWRQFARAVCAYRIYGWLHACTVPLRAPWGNAINFCATARALLTFARARVLRQPLRWAKTAHDYPRPESLAARRPVALPKAPRLPMMPGLPKMKVRLVLPGWLAIHRRLSVTLECRRVRRPAIRL